MNIYPIYYTDNSVYVIIELGKNVVCLKVKV